MVAVFYLSHRKSAVRKWQEAIGSTHSKCAVRKGASGRCIQDAEPLKQRAPARTHVSWALEEIESCSGGALIVAFVS